MCLRNHILLAALAALLVVAGARLAWAQAVAPSEPTLELTWHAPDGCPGQEQVEAQIRRLAVQARPEDAPLRAQVEIAERRRGLWRMSLVTSRGSSGGHRVLEGDSCQNVADAAIVIIALTLDPTLDPTTLSTPAAASAPNPPAAPAAPAPNPIPAPAAASAPTPNPPVAPAAPVSDPIPAAAAASAPTPSPPVAPVPARLPEPAPVHAGASTSARRLRPQRPPTPPSPLRIALGAGLVVDVGAMPTIAPGPALSGVVRWRALRVEGLAAVLPYSEGTAPVMQGGGEFFLAFGGVAACGVAPLGPLELGGCAGFEAGVLHGHGVHVLRPLDAAEPWLALSPSARVLLPLGPRFALRLDVGPTIPLLRPQFYFYPANPEESGTVYQPSPATFRALLGGELRF